MKVVALIFLLAGLLLVTVLISPAFAATGVVSLPAVTGRFLQVEFSDLAGITMNGQTLSIDFAFSTPFHVDGRPLWSELFLQTAPHTDPDSQEDYPYTQYVVFGTGTRAYVTAENGDLLDAPTPTAAVLLTDRGLAGAAMTANPPIGIKVAGIHFDLVLPDTGETLVLGRIAVKIEEGADDSNPSHLPDSPGNSDNNSRRDTTTSISVTNQTASGASISWSTDKIDTFVEVGTTPSYGQQIAPQSQESGNYSVNVSGLASNTTYHYRITSRDGEGNITTSADHTFITSFSIPNEGGTVRTTAGNVSLVAGYGRPQRESGGTPSGLAIFENRQSGLLVNEVAVPAVPSMYSGRIPIEVSVDGSINTGIAIANPNSEDAWISFDLRTAEGNIYQSGSFILSGASTPCDPGNSCNHLSQFVDDSPLFGGRNIEGTLSFTSTVPISLIAVRSFVNERGDFLMTNVPVTDLSLSAVTAMQVVPQFSVGNGMKTEIALMNPTGMELRGRMEFLDPSGAPALVKVGGSYSHTVQYTIAPNGTQRVVVAEGLAPVMSGSVWVSSTDDNPVPAPLAIISYKPGEFTESFSSVPVTMGTAFRVYTQYQSSPQIDTAIAIANATGSGGTVTLSLTDLEGQFLTSETWSLAPLAQIRGGMRSLLPSIAGQQVQGILRVTTDLPNISVVGFREHYNERESKPDFLFTAIAPVLENAAPQELVFPQLLSGDGFTTKIILYSGSAGGSSEGTMIFIRPDGTPSIIDIR